MEQIVKVQLPLDRAQMARGKLYVDPNNPVLMVYDEKREHVWAGADPELRAFMLAADEGVGFVKAFMHATWDAKAERWSVNFKKGFVPLRNW